MSTLTVTISGPAASGKSTVGRALAKALKEAGHFVFFTDDEVRVDIDALPDLRSLVKAVDPQHLVPYQIIIDTEET
jgi:uridine kinase